MRRRSLLAAGGTALLGPGCLRETGPSLDPATDPATENGRDGETGTTERTGTAGASGLTITDAGVYPGVVTMGDDSFGTADGAGQYLLVRTEIVPDRPNADAFEFAVGGETYVHEVPPGILHWPEGLSASDSFGRWLIVPLPETVDGAADARLTWPGGEWTPPEAVRDRLEAPLPELEVTFDAPDAVAPGESPTLSLSVYNPADIGGNAVLALNRVGPRIAYAPVREIVAECPPGKTVTREFDAHSPHEPTEPREVTYHLHVAGGSRVSRTIEPEE